MKKLLPLFLFVLFCTPQKSEPHLFISLKDWNGKTVKLSEFKGKIIVLDFWASWCEPCKKSIPVIEALKKKSDNGNVVFLGVNTDIGKKNEEIQKIAKEFGMSYESLLDPDLILSDSLQISGLPALAFFDKDGILNYRQYGISSNDFPFLSNKLKNLATQ